MILVLISSMAVMGLADNIPDINSNKSIIFRSAYGDIIYSDESSIAGAAYSNVGGTLNCPNGKTLTNYDPGFLGK
jgi:hypothetical protein